MVRERKIIMACQVLVEFRIKDGCEEKLKQTIKQFLPDTRDFPGCLTLHMVRDKEDPTKIIIVEMWESKDDYDKYLAWRTDRGDVDLLSDFWEDPTWRFFDFWGA